MSTPSRSASGCSEPAGAAARSVVLAAGTGIGAGIVLDGRIVRGDGGLRRRAGPRARQVRRREVLLRRSRMPVDLRERARDRRRGPGARGRPSEARLVEAAAGDPRASRRSSSFAPPRTATTWRRDRRQACQALGAMIRIIVNGLNPGRRHHRRGRPVPGSARGQRSSARRPSYTLPRALASRASRSFRGQAGRRARRRRARLYEERTSRHESHHASRAWATCEAQDVADPKIVDPTDVVLRITTSAVCGSDLHQYHGRGGALAADRRHRWATSSWGPWRTWARGVRQLRRGDRVIVPFSVSCGACEWCRAGCRPSAPPPGAPSSVAGSGTSGAEGRPSGSGCRSPEHLCEKVPAEMSDHDAIFLGDILSTGYCCAENGGIRPGDVVAVFRRGARRAAGDAGGAALRTGEALRRRPRWLPAEARRGVRRRAGEASTAATRPSSCGRGRARRGPDVVLECVGHETPFTQAIQAVRPGGAVSSVGVYVETSMGFPAREAFFKDLSLKMGICNARNYMAPLLPLVQGGKLRPARIITHTLALARRAEGLRDLRPEGGPGDQGDAQALTHEGRRTASSRARRECAAACQPPIGREAASPSRPSRSITTV